MDTTLILETTLAEECELPSSPVPAAPSHAVGTDLSRYFWPRYALPVLSGAYLTATEAMATAGMTLTSLVYDARKTIMNLGSVIVEFEPLLHTSPQIYTHKQWNGIVQVPRTHRGFKIGYALEFTSHVLSWNTFDNNFRLHWRTPDEHIKNYRSSHVPDVIFDYPAWSNYTVCWLKEMRRKSLKNLTILEVLSAPGRQPFRGLGRYGANEVLSIAGIPGWVLVAIVIDDPVLFSIVCESFYKFVYDRVIRVGTYCDLPTSSDSEDLDFAISTTLKKQLEYINTLRTHGRARTHVSSEEAKLIDAYNSASLKTWDESKTARDVFAKSRKTDMSKIVFPFDFANVLASVTKFGHLGSLIAGQYWDSVLGELIAHKETLRKLEAEYCSLPTHFTQNQLLFLKPKHLISRRESDSLVRSFGWAQNPIATYFEVQSKISNTAARFGRIDQSRLSLTSKRTRWRKTYLVKMENRTGFMWSTLHPPFISLSTRARKNKQEETLYLPLYSVQAKSLRDEYTIQHIKEKTKGWTVGPKDFVGHGRIIKKAKVTFTGLCFWHPNLTVERMLIMKAAWDARSRYVAGRKVLAKQTPNDHEATWKPRIAGVT
ncbi:hypothetical protein C8R47DRAFT_1217442 [Mycena vitilis]|nr:hypothetical protein C8R47DRAFT_1217442 [Mycena vitilis]